MVETEVLSGTGLRDQVAGQTALSTVGQEDADLTYRGCDIRDLATAAIFGEVAYLLLYGGLPDKQQPDAYLKKPQGQRDLPQALKEVLERILKDVHLVDMVHTDASVLGALEPKLNFGRQRDVADRLFAAFPVIIAYWYCFTHEGQRIDCNSDEPTIDGCFPALPHGRKPNGLHVGVMDVSLISYAEREFNTPTFIARICASTLSSLYPYVTDIVGLLHDPLHGGAGEAAMELTERFPSLQETTTELLKMLKHKDKIMGFGYAIYKDSDSCDEVIKGQSKQLVNKVGDKVLFAVPKAVDKTMWEQKRLFPGAGSYHASAYRFVNIPTKLFTSTFIYSWTSDWTAHVFGQCASNHVIRPSTGHTGVEQRAFVPLEQRWSAPPGASNASTPDGCRTRDSRDQCGLRHGASDMLLNTP